MRHLWSAFCFLIQAVLSSSIGGNEIPGGGLEGVEAAISFSSAVISAPKAASSKRGVLRYLIVFDVNQQRGEYSNTLFLILSSEEGSTQIPNIYGVNQTDCYI